MKKVFSCSIFDLVETPYKGRSFIRLESNDWVNILAINNKNELLLIRQFRHGTQSVCLETPGGFVDDHEKSEPFESAKRELLEETGYDSSDWVTLGSLDTNPAYQNNKCHYFLARNVQYKQKQSFDPGEEILEVVFVPMKEVLQQIRNGTITHSVVAAGLSLYQNSEYFIL